eukprot:9111262-Pyramimonas_sp.AAC.2
MRRIRRSRWLRAARSRSSSSASSDTMEVVTDRLEDRAELERIACAPPAPPAKVASQGAAPAL